MLEEDFLDLLAQMLRDMPNEELWQTPFNHFDVSQEAGMAGASMLTVHAPSAIACFLHRLGLLFVIWLWHLSAASAACAGSHV